MEKLIVLKGILIGIAKIIPGFSGAVLMMSFHLYDRAICAITHFFDDKKRNFLFLLKLEFGILIGIVFFSKIIHFFLNHYYHYTIMFFIGLVIGGFPKIMNDFSINKRNVFLCLVSFLSVLCFSIFPIHHTYLLRHSFFDSILFFLSGFLEAIGTVIPGVSSTVLLMLIGIYPYYIRTISHLLSVSFLLSNLYFFIPFLLGCFIGFILISLLMNYLFHYYSEETYSVIFGFSLGSVVLLLVHVMFLFSHLLLFFFGIVLLVLGVFIASKI